MLAEAATVPDDDLSTVDGDLGESDPNGGRGAFGAGRFHDLILTAARDWLRMRDRMRKEAHPIPQAQLADVGRSQCAEVQSVRLHVECVKSVHVNRLRFEGF
jgi:hypothetical protein